VALSLLCYALLVAAWIVDLVTPQSFVTAILFNGPIALSGLALRPRLTLWLCVFAQLFNVIAGYVNGAEVGYRWDGIAIGDRLLAAASFALVAYLTILAQRLAREAGESSGRARQVAVERTLRAATARVRETLNFDLVRRSILGETNALLGAASSRLIVNDRAGEPPLIIRLDAAGEPTYDRVPLSPDLASLVAKAREDGAIVHVTAADAIGRLRLEALDAGEALAGEIPAQHADAAHVLVAIAAPQTHFAEGSATIMADFVEQAAVALEQAYVFTELGRRNEEIAQSRNEIARTTDVIRDMIYTLAHDLRTPLVAAGVTMKQAIDGAFGDLPERYREVLRASRASNEEARRIVETLLLVARYETGEESRVNDRVDCDALIETAIEELDPLARSNGITLKADVRERPLTVAGDPHEIRRALLNLVANAIAATARNGTVVLSGYLEGSDVVLEVTDDGYGVSPERRSSLFERFGGTRGAVSSGLGLYIVRRIAEKHGGSVSYRPREPRGSIFTLRLPQAGATAVATANG
jgi:two-component system, OmpR family, sensor histidine kinase KdpD